MKGWIYTVILFILFAVLLYSLWGYTHSNREGFVLQNFNLRDAYVGDEIFLVAPNNVNVFSSDTVDYTKGYTYDDAMTACSKNGGVLAALGSATDPCSDGLTLNCAKANLAVNWCVNGWVNGDSTNVYSPCQTLKGIGDNLTPIPATTKAFAFCVGKKPLEPVYTNAAYINPLYIAQPFSLKSYLMIDDLSMNDLMTGMLDQDGLSDDMFPKNFTKSQVYYALEKNKYDKEAARTYLINVYKQEELNKTSTARDTNTEILNLVDPSLGLENPNTDRNHSVNPSDPNAKIETCDKLMTIHNNIRDKINALKGIFQNLNDNVDKSTKYVNNNKILQTTLQTGIDTNTRTIEFICNTGDSTVSPACRRLISLESDLYYKPVDKTLVDPITGIESHTTTTMLHDLEQLNLGLSMRQCEIQQSLGSLEFIMNTIKCSEIPATLGKNYTFDRALFKTNTINGNPIKCPKDDEEAQKYENDISDLIGDDRIGINDKPFKIGNISKNPNKNYTPDIDLNRVYTLKNNLEQLSPFYNNSDFTLLMSDIIEQLSVIIKTPTIFDYQSPNTIFKKAATESDLIYNWSKTP